MDNYKKRQEERESEFKKDLLALLCKHNATIEVSDTPLGYSGYDIDVEVELEGKTNSDGDMVEPYTYFTLSKYMNKDTGL